MSIITRVVVPTLVIGGTVGAAVSISRALSDDESTSAKPSNDASSSKSPQRDVPSVDLIPTPVAPAGAGTPVAQVVDGIMELYDADSDGTITYGEGGPHSVTGEALRQKATMTQVPHGPVQRTFDTLAIESLVATADSLDGAVDGTVSRLELMTVAGAFDLAGTDGRDQRLNHDEKTSFERLFRERRVDSKPLADVIHSSR